MSFQRKEGREKEKNRTKKHMICPSVCGVYIQWNLKRRLSGSCPATNRQERERAISTSSLGCPCTCTRVSSLVALLRSSAVVSSSSSLLSLMLPPSPHRRVLLFSSLSALWSFLFLPFPSAAKEEKKTEFVKNWNAFLADLNKKKEELRQEILSAQSSSSASPRARKSRPTSSSLSDRLEEKEKLRLAGSVEEGGSAHLERRQDGSEREKDEDDDDVEISPHAFRDEMLQSERQALALARARHLTHVLDAVHKSAHARQRRPLSPSSSSPSYGNRLSAIEKKDSSESEKLRGANEGQSVSAADRGQGGGGGEQGVEERDEEEEERRRKRRRREQEERERHERSITAGYSQQAIEAGLPYRHSEKATRTLIALLVSRPVSKQLQVEVLSSFFSLSSREFLSLFFRSRRFSTHRHEAAQMDGSYRITELPRSPLSRRQMTRGESARVLDPREKERQRERQRETDVLGALFGLLFGVSCGADRRHEDSRVGSNRRKRHCELSPHSVHAQIRTQCPTYTCREIYIYIYVHTEVDIRTHTYRYM